LHCNLIVKVGETASRVAERPGPARLDRLARY
jgi:hypothetical protein